MTTISNPLSLAQRWELCEALTDDVAAPLRLALAGDDVEAFDALLLAHCRRRAAPRFFFERDAATELAADIVARLPDQAAIIIDWAESVLQHRFQASDDRYIAYDVQLSADFSWYEAPGIDGEFIYALNRHRFWVHLAVAYRFTGDARFTETLRRHIESWCAETPPLDDLDAWITPQVAPRWWLLDTAIRADTWLWTYCLLVDTPEWTPALNSLFVSFLWQHGRFLHHNLPRTHQHLPIAGVNWLIMEAQGLLGLALLFPEFKASPRWEQMALPKLEECLHSQFRTDGGHVEQSPSYHECCLYWLAEPLYLAQLNGRALAETTWLRLVAAGEAMYQLMQPDGGVPALSDSDRASNGALTQMGLLLNQPQWACFEGPSARDAWFFGAVPPLKAAAPVRPTAVAMRETGYYVLRSGDDPDAVQLILDCGPKGEGHGHFDLLGIELYGHSLCLIPDPGRLTYSDGPDRAWLVGTPAHNTISIDGENHAALEGTGNPALHLFVWNPEPGNVMIAAGHDGYGHLPGAPRVARAVWFDGEGTFVILDQARSGVEHEFMVSFTLPGSAVALVNGAIHNDGDRHCFTLRALPMGGQQTRLRDSFWSPNYGEKQPATRLELTQKGSEALFATVIRTGAVRGVDDLLTSWVAAPGRAGKLEISLMYGGHTRIVEFPRLLSDD